ncbi:hypothetical protein F542_4310 [Bibersteinia trehalosi USDA-ARS-USMARC-188]|uniref:Uncharacterized protein n=1 Tax=Bibersteinia trehalosi USDA-ARS-USMARC-188 TaxID=1263829 RepID=A0A4V7I826_BIBTR|nr:hypothetical protein F542_4310 [Bibersteinia trehalosi USDA-ARS-USMARC-188]
MASYSIEQRAKGKQAVVFLLSFTKFSLYSLSAAQRLGRII